MASPQYDQDAFKIRDDSAFVNQDSGWLGALNAGIDLENDTTVRIRFVIQEYNNKAANNIVFALRYQANGSGGYTNVVTAANADVALVDSTLNSDHSATTQLIGTGTYTTGESDGFDDGTIDDYTANIDFDGNDEAELEFCFEIPSTGAYGDGDYLEFRVYTSGGSSLNTYTNTARIDIIAGVTTHQISATGAGLMANDSAAVLVAVESADNAAVLANNGVGLNVIPHSADGMGSFVSNGSIAYVYSLAADNAAIGVGSGLLVGVVLADADAALLSVMNGVDVYVVPQNAVGVGLAVSNGDALNIIPHSADAAGLLIATGEPVQIRLLSGNMAGLSGFDAVANLVFTNETASGFGLFAAAADPVVAVIVQLDGTGFGLSIANGDPNQFVIADGSGLGLLATNGDALNVIPHSADAAGLFAADAVGGILYTETASGFGFLVSNGIIAGVVIADATGFELAGANGSFVYVVPVESSGFGLSGANGSPLGIVVSNADAVGLFAASGVMLGEGIVLTAVGAGLFVGYAAYFGAATRIIFDLDSRKIYYLFDVRKTESAFDPRSIGFELEQ